jgi:hypothetical protein
MNDECSEFILSLRLGSIFSPNVGTCFRRIQVPLHQQHTEIKMAVVGIATEPLGFPNLPLYLYQNVP